MSLLRARLRTFVAEQIALTCPTIGVEQNRAISTTTAALPAVIVNTPQERKESLVRGGPQFNTTVLVQIVARVSGSSDPTTLAALEDMLEQIEAATLSNQALIDQVQQFSSVHVEQKLTGQGGDFVAEGIMHIECEMYQDYRDPVSEPFLDIRATVTDQAAPAVAVATFDVTLPQEPPCS